MNIITTLLLVIVAETVLIALLSWRNSSNVPPEVLRLIFNFLATTAAKTDDPNDDKIVAAIGRIAGIEVLADSPSDPALGVPDGLEDLSIYESQKKANVG